MGAEEMTTLAAIARQLRGLAWLGDVHDSGEGASFGQRQHRLQVLLLLVERGMTFESL